MKGVQGQTIQGTFFVEGRAVACVVCLSRKLYQTKLCAEGYFRIDFKGCLPNLKQKVRRHAVRSFLESCPGRLSFI